MLTWLNNYAHENRTSRSKVVRAALVAFRSEHRRESAPDEQPQIDNSRRCVECGATVVRQYGLAICTIDGAHTNEL